MIENKYVRDDPEFVVQALRGITPGYFATSGSLGLAVSAEGISYDMLARPLDAHYVRLFGLFAPATITPTNTELPTGLYNVTDVRHLPTPHLRHIDRLRAGVGGRLYNTVDAIANSQDRDFPCALYSTIVDMRHVYDGRSATNEKYGQIGRFVAQAGLVWNLMNKGPYEVLEQVEGQYESDCEAAFWSQPPHNAARLKPEGQLPLTFAVIRHGLSFSRESEQVL